MAEVKIIALLLAGGAGTRLWPVSRDAMPKQFLPLTSDRSIYQQALARVRAPELFAPPIVMTASGPKNWGLTRRSCSSRCGAIPGRRLRPAQRWRFGAIRTRSCSRSPPTM
jgi:hypothetical protein